MGLMFFSCNSNEKAAKEPQVNDNILYQEKFNQNQEAYQRTVLNDTVEFDQAKATQIFDFGGYKFTITKETIPKYISFEDMDGVYTRSKEMELIEGFDNVERFNDTLQFLINDDYLMRLFDVKFDEGAKNYEDVTDFYFQGKIGDLDYWKIFFVGHEYSGTVLMHQKTGEKLYTLHNYVQGLDADFVLFYNEDLDSRFIENGFHLLHIENEKLKDGGILEFDMWGPKSIVYDSLSSKYYMQRVFLDGYNTEMDTVVMDIQPYAAETDS